MKHVLNILDELNDSLSQNKHYNNAYEYYESYYEDIILSIEEDSFNYSHLETEDQLRAILQDKTISVELLYKILNNEWKNLFNIKIKRTSSIPLIDSKGQHLPEVSGNSQYDIVSYILDSIWCLNNGDSIIRYILNEIIFFSDVEKFYEKYKRHQDLFYKYGLKINYNEICIEEILVDWDKFIVIDFLDNLVKNDKVNIKDVLWSDLNYNNPHYLIRNTIIDYYINFENYGFVNHYRDTIFFLIQNLKENFNIYEERKDLNKNIVPYAFKKTLKNINGISESQISNSINILELFKNLNFDFSTKIKKNKINILSYLIAYTKNEYFLHNTKVWKKILFIFKINNIEIDFYSYKTLSLIPELKEELKEFRRFFKTYSPGVYEKARIKNKIKDIKKYKELGVNIYQKNKILDVAKELSKKTPYWRSETQISIISEVYKHFKENDVKIDDLYDSMIQKKISI